MNLKGLAYVFLISALFAAGCAKPYDRNELFEVTGIPDNFSNAPSLKAVSGKNAPIDTEDNLLNFLYMFQDGDLKKVIDTVLEKNTDLLTLSSKIIQAREIARSSFSDMFPKADIGIDYNYSDGNYKKYQTNVTQNTVNANIGFSWEADIFGKLNSLRLASREQIAYAEENLANGRVSLIAEAANYYFTIRDTAFSIEVSKKIIANLERILKVQESSLAVGMVDETQTASAKMDILSEKNNLRSLQAALEENKNALLVLMDEKSLNFDPSSAYDMPLPKIPGINAIPGAAIFNRPDVKAGLYSLNTEIYKRNSAKAALFPSLKISGNIGQILASSNGPGDLIWQIAGSLAAPLLNRASLYADLKIQEEARKQAEYALKRSVSSALSEIETAAFKMDAADHTLENSRHYLKNAQISLEVNEGRFSGGLMGETDYLKSKNNTLAAEKTLQSSKLNNIQSSINLYKAFGGSFAVPAGEGENVSHNK